MNMSKQRLYVVIAAAIGVVSTFMPWMSGMGVTVSGTKGDGWITLVFFVAAIVVSLLTPRTTLLDGWQKWVVAALGAACALMGVFELSDINNRISQLGMFSSMASTGAGLYVLLIAGIAVCALAFMGKITDGNAPK